MESLNWKILLVFMLGYVTADSRVSPVAKTKLGDIIGTTKEVIVFGRKMTVNRFFGIPYAEAPVGELRFKKPIPKKQLTTPFKAFGHGKACLQLMYMRMSDRKDKEIPLGEDCLFLNVYVPADTRKDRVMSEAYDEKLVVIDENRQLPVMVWLHGGGFWGGASNNYIADTLAAFGDVIVVTVNYRLSIWGFLSTDDEHAPGNYGLWDQHMALQWIHDNINEFGGDPNTVTIFGESAGGASVVYQSLFEGNKALFQRAIAQSGSITAHWATRKTPKQDAIRLGKIVGCYHTDSKDLIDCLRTQKPELLNETLNDFENGPVDEFDIPFLPTVDGKFVKESPLELLMGDSEVSSNDRKMFGSIDFMSSVNAAEGIVAVIPEVGIEDPEHFEPNRTFYEETLLPILMKMAFGEDLHQDVMNLITHEYTDWEDQNNVEKRRNNYIACFSHAWFSTYFIGTVARHSEIAGTSKNTYSYIFDIVPSRRVYELPSWAEGASHGDDLVYTFFEESDGVLTYFYGNEDFKPTDYDREQAKYFMTLLTNFAKTG